MTTSRKAIDRDEGWRSAWYWTFGFVVGIGALSLVRDGQIPPYMGNIIGAAIGTVGAIYAGVYLSNRKVDDDRTRLARSLLPEILALTESLARLQRTDRHEPYRSVEFKHRVEDVRRHLPLPLSLGIDIVESIKWTLIAAQQVITALDAEEESRGAPQIERVNRAESVRVAAAYAFRHCTDTIRDFMKSGLIDPEGESADPEGKVGKSS